MMNGWEGALKTEHAIGVIIIILLSVDIYLEYKTLQLLQASTLGRTYG